MNTTGRLAVAFVISICVITLVILFPISLVISTLGIQIQNFSVILIGRFLSLLPLSFITILYIVAIVHTYRQTHNFIQIGVASLILPILIIAIALNLITGWFLPLILTLFFLAISGIPMTLRNTIEMENKEASASL